MFLPVVFLWNTAAMSQSYFKTHDIFISYVVEDREIVEEFYRKLTEAGLRIWYAKRELFIGANINKLVGDGLKSARYGVAIISSHYTSHWSQGELFVLFYNGREKLLPVLHNLTYAELLTINPQLSQFYCLDTRIGIDNIIKSILDKVKPRSAIYYFTAKVLKFLKVHIKRIVWGILTTLLAITSIYIYRYMKPPDSFIETVIRERGVDLQKLANDEVHQKLTQSHVSLATLEEVAQRQQTLLMTYPSDSCGHHVVYTDGYDTITSVDGLVRAGIFSTIFQVKLPFQLKDCRSYLVDKKDNPGGQWLTYALYNMQPLHYKVVDESMKRSTYDVEVQYSNPVRYVEVSIHIDVAGRIQHRRTRFIGLKNRETFVFEKEDRHWIFSALY